MFGFGSTSRWLCGLCKLISISLSFFSIMGTIVVPHPQENLHIRRGGVYKGFSIESDSKMLTTADPEDILGVVVSLWVGRCNNGGK